MSLIGPGCSPGVHITRKSRLLSLSNPNLCRTLLTHPNFVYVRHNIGHWKNVGLKECYITILVGPEKTRRKKVNNYNRKSSFERSKNHQNPTSRTVEQVLSTMFGGVPSHHKEAICIVVQIDTFCLFGPHRQLSVPFSALLGALLVSNNIWLYLYQLGSGNFSFSVPLLQSFVHYIKEAYCSNG